MEIIIAVILGLAIFVCNVLSFGLGIKYGLSIKKGVQPKIEPFKPILEVQRTQGRKGKGRNR